MLLEATAFWGLRRCLGMITPLASKAKDQITALDLASIFARPSGRMISYLGSLIWGAWLFLRVAYGFGVPWWVTIFAMAIIWIAVPMGLRLADQHGAGPLTPAVGVLRIVVIPTAALTSLALAGSPGFSSAVLTIPWLLFSSWAAGVGFIRFLSRPCTTLDSLVRDISLFALAPSALVLTVSRIAIAPFGLSVGLLTFIAGWGMALVWLLPLWANRRTQTRTTWEPVVVHLARRTLVDLFSLRERAMKLAPTVQPGLARRELPPGYTLDEWSLPVDDFDNSCEALWNWAGHGEAGVMLNPAQPPITLGETFALGIPFGPLSVSGSCRIIGVVDEPEAYGFGFSTLGHHAWSAEQSLVITNIDGNPSVTATVAWAPTIVGSRLIPPLTRYLIGRYVMGILKGIAEAEVAALHYRMQEIVQQVPIPKTYRVPEVVEVPEIAIEESKPETGAELLDRYENSWF